MAPVARPAMPALPQTSSDALWNFARDVDAAFVKTIDPTRETGVPSTSGSCSIAGWARRGCRCGRMPDSGGTLTLDREPSLGDGVRHVFVLRVENGRGAFDYRPALRPGERSDRRDPVDGTAPGPWPSSPRRSPTPWPRG